MQSIDRTQVSLRIPNDVLSDFDKIAQILERDRSWVMLRAFKAFLAEEGAAILDEAEAMATLDRGEGADLEDVISDARELLSAAAAKATRKIG